MNPKSELYQNLRVVMLPIDTLHPNNWNPNVVPEHKRRALKNYIEKTGFVQPILVRPDRNGGYEITDGQHRWEIVKELGANEIPAIVLKENDVDSKLRTVAVSSLRGQFVPVKLANVIHDLTASSRHEKAFLPLNQRSKQTRELPILKVKTYPETFTPSESFNACVKPCSEAFTYSITVS